MSTIHSFETFFYGKDILIDVISTIIILLILKTVSTYYKIDYQDKKKYFIYSFTALAISFIFRIIGHALIYYYNTTQNHIGLITLTYQSIFEASTLVFISLTLYKILALLGFYFLYATYFIKNISLKHYIVLIPLATLLTYFTHNTYYIFHALILILLSVTAYKLFQISKQKTNKHTKFIASAFFVLGISQLFFILISIHNIFYIIANTIQLIGFLILLYQFVKVTHYGKKKRTN